MSKKNISFLKKESDYLERKNEPYRSIINTLEIAPKFNDIFKHFLEVKELRFLLVNGYSIKKGGKPMRLKILYEFKAYLQKRKNDVKLDQDISPLHQGFNWYLAKLESVGWIERSEGSCCLAAKQKFKPLKWRQKQMMEEKSFDSTIYGSDFTFYLPDNTPMDDFERKDRVRINKIKDDFLTSMTGLFTEIKIRRAREVWTKKIINVDCISPLVKLWLWVHLFVDIFYLSSLKVFLSSDADTVSTKKGKLPREKVIESWKKEREYLKEAFLDYFVLLDMWAPLNGRIRYPTKEEANQISAQIMEERENIYLYCSSVVSEINELLAYKDYMFIMSPHEEICEYYTLGDTDNPTEYTKSHPGRRMRFYSKSNDNKILNAINAIRSIEEQLGLVKKEEVVMEGTKRFLFEHEIPDEEEKQRVRIPCDLDAFYNTGKAWLDNITPSLRNRLLAFCRSLGSTDKKRICKLIGEFLSIHSMPHVPEPRELLKKK